MNATDKDLNVQKVLKTTEKNFPSTSKALGNVDRAFDNTKRMKTSYDADSRVLMSVTFKRARSGCHESSGEAKQRRSKKVGCNYELVCTIRRDQPDVVHYEERHGHSGHVPGSTEDLKYLSLHPDIFKLAKEACNKLKNVLKELPGPDASYLTAEINNLLEKAKSRRPSLAPTTKAMDKKETKKLSRMPKDRVTRPLYPGRSKSKREDANTVEAPAVALDHAVSVAGAAMLQPSQDPGMEDNGVSPPALVRRNDIGRPREQKRGMENEGLVRHGKAGGLRTPRKRRYKKDDNEVF
ncbi:hypothetical protein NADE_001912 [Nannochloris sp. 'desiccata']|nr:hypothetical protein NADE_001912 [Chlorella desiccata (nom. nud.)]